MSYSGSVPIKVTEEPANIVEISVDRWTTFAVAAG